MNGESALLVAFGKYTLSKLYSHCTQLLYYTSIEIWYQIFLYCLATTVLMHVIAAVVSLRSIRKHRVCRYLPVVLIIAGFLYPLTGGMLTS